MLLHWFPISLTRSPTLFLQCQTIIGHCLLYYIAQLSQYITVLYTIRNCTLAEYITELYPILIHCRVLAYLNTYVEASSRDPYSKTREDIPVRAAETLNNRAFWNFEHMSFNESTNCRRESQHKLRFF